jgi:shikimate 5-dehydrogenase
MLIEQGIAAFQLWTSNYSPTCFEVMKQTVMEQYMKTHAQ